MEDIYRSQFRLPYSLYEQLKESADNHHRSVNAELVARLEESFISNDVDFMEKINASAREAIDRFNAPSIEDRLISVEQQLQQVLELLQKK